MFAKRVSAATRLFRQSASWISRAGLGTGLVGTIAFASRHSNCASPDGEISQTDVANMSKTTTSSPVFKIARNTTATDLQDGGAMLDRDVFARSNHVFSHLVPKQGKATNQASSGRCWLFAYLNQVRQQMMIDLDLPESFELSQNYLFFFDKLERCNYILECYIQTAGEDLDSRRVQHLLKSPSEDGGQYSMIQAVVSKYGIVPQSAYPEATGGCRSVHMRRVMNVKMREFCKDLREAVARGATRKELDGMKKDMMAIIYRILATHLGEPPKKFDWEYVNTKKEYHEVRDVTPKEFAEKHAGMSNVKEFVSLVNDPRNKYYRTYTVDMLGNVVGTDTPVLYLNVPMDVLKQVAATEIAEGRSVWFGSDVGKDFVRKFSMLGPEYQDMGEVYGTTSGLTKGDRLRYGQSLMTHAMLLTGVHVPGCGTRKVTTGKGKGKDEEAGGSSSPIDASKVTKWRIQNSWGTRLGNEGYLTATDAWMDEWCYQVVVEKHRLPERARIALETEPVVLPPWDPMGALAVGFEAKGEAEAAAAGAADEGRE